MAIVRDAMPAQLRVSHACLGHAMPAIKLVAPMSKQIAGKHIRLRSVQHSGSDTEMLASMAESDLDAKHLSHVVGGGFTHEHFEDWLSTQRNLEDA